MFRCVCTSRDSVLYARALLLHAVSFYKLYVRNPREIFYFACLAECCRLSLSNENKKIQTTTNKNTPRGEQTFYLRDYSLNTCKSTYKFPLCNTKNETIRRNFQTNLSGKKTSAVDGFQSANISTRVSCRCLLEPGHFPFLPSIGEGIGPSAFDPGKAGTGLAQPSDPSWSMVGLMILLGLPTSIC